MHAFCDSPCCVGCDASDAARLRRVICLTLAICVSALFAGCRLVGNRGPIPKEVAACRQLSQRAASAIERGEWSTAESLLLQAIKTYPNDPSARRYYAEVLWQRGAQQEALVHAEEALLLAGDDAAAAVRLGEMNLSMGRRDEARRLAQEAIDIQPQFAAGWALRARVEQAEREVDAAVADFQRALQYDPNNRELLLETAELYRQLGRPKRVLSTLTALRETYQNGDEPVRLLVLEGEALAALGRHAEAVQSYWLAIQSGQPSAELLAQLAESQLRLGQLAEAERSTQQALALDPQHASSRSLLARIEGIRTAQLERPRQ